jgi:hypothetical protein
MLGSIDCMHWRWKNCPKAWHDFYCGKSRDPTIMLEAIASHDLCGFGIVFLDCRDLDINVLHRSHLFAKLASGEATACNYKVNGHDYTMRYYLAEDIYPSWEFF